MGRVRVRSEADFFFLIDCYFCSQIFRQMITLIVSIRAKKLCPQYRLSRSRTCASRLISHGVKPKAKNDRCTLLLISIYELIVVEFSIKIYMTRFRCWTRALGTDS